MPNPHDVEYQEAGGFSRRNVRQEEQDYLSNRDIRQSQHREAIVRSPDGPVDGRVKPWEHLSTREKAQLTGD